MRTRRLLRFVLALFGGLVLVWFFGVDSGESLLGTRRPRIPVDDEQAAEPSEPDAGDVALADATIPVREVGEDGRERLRYVIHVGHAVSGGGRTLPARDVRIEIMDETGGHVAARLAGPEADLVFAEPLDASTGFRGATIERLSLRGGALVEQCDARGEVVTTLRAPRIDLQEQVFRAEGPVEIRQRGFLVRGRDLVFERKSGRLQIAREVEVSGTSLLLPGSEPEEPVEEAPREPKRLTCEGPFVFLPFEAEAVSADRGDDPLGGLAGALLEFHGSVVASGEGREIRCERLEMRLLHAAGEGEDRWEVESALAEGAPAVLRSDEGTVSGERIRLARSESGEPVVIVERNAKLRDLAWNENSIEAAARERLLLEPDERGEEGGTSLSLRLEGEAVLLAKGEGGFEISAPTVNLRLSRQNEPQPPAQGDGSTLRLEELTAGEGCRVRAEGVDLTARRLVGRPLAEGDGLAVELLPDPALLFHSSSGEEDPLWARLACEDGTLTIVPRRQDGGADLVVRAAGAPVRLDLRQGDNQSVRLETGGTLRARLEPEGEPNGAAGGLSALVAEGGASLEAPAHGLRATGSTIRLEPGTGSGPPKAVLLGEPAEAVVRANVEQPERRVRARRIEFDPQDGVLRAEGDVVSPLAEGPGAGAVERTLRCDALTVRVPEGGGPARIEALGRVALESSSGERALADRLVYDESEGLARLFGAPALVERPGTGGARMEGPLLLLDVERSRLVCPAEGAVVVERPREAGSDEVVIRARSAGPIEALEDRLELRDDVVIAVEEGGEETRSVFCDRCSVVFARGDEKREEDGPAGAAGVESIVAEGWVRIEQRLPRPLVAEGRRLVYRFEGDDEIAELFGGDPPAWVEGAWGQPEVRDVADRFVIRLRSQEVLSENGRTVVVGRARLP